MKKEIADQWVAALRSGKYKQGFGRLKYGHAYCCLGVLCELSGIEYRADDFFPPPVGVRDWAGLKTASGHLPNHGIELTEWNDDGKPFSEIADIIEKHWEEL